jgi:hypothetical protein
MTLRPSLPLLGLQVEETADRLSSIAAALRSMTPTRGTPVNATTGLRSQPSSPAVHISVNNHRPQSPLLSGAAAQKARSPGASTAGSHARTLAAEQDTAASNRTPGPQQPAMSSTAPQPTGAQLTQVSSVNGSKSYSSSTTPIVLGKTPLSQATTTQQQDRRSATLPRAVPPRTSASAAGSSGSSSGIGRFHATGPSAPLGTTSTSKAAGIGRGTLHSTDGSIQAGGSTTPDSGAASGVMGSLKRVFSSKGR